MFVKRVDSTVPVFTCTLQYREVKFAVSLLESWYAKLKMFNKKEFNENILFSSNNVILLMQEILFSFERN